MIHLKWQSYWCTIAPMGNISELSRQIFHNNDKKKWTQHRCLMYSYWNVNWVAMAFYDSDFSRSIVIHRLKNLNNPFINFKFPHCPRKNYFYKVHDWKPFLGQQMQSRFFFINKYFSCSISGTSTWHETKLHVIDRDLFPCDGIKYLWNLRPL